MAKPAGIKRTLLRRVLTTIAAHGMVSHGDHVLAAVSGGADSVAMLHLLFALRDRLGIRLSVAHMDHRIRGRESRREAAFVQKLAVGLGLACIAEARDVPAHRAAGRLSLQEAARDVRYAFFRDAMAAAGADRVALAHQAEDQAETVLMRLLRGAGLRGLAGIPPCREGALIRPLIAVRREEIEAYLRDEEIAFVADTSVHEQHYLRNRIRHGLLPLLRREYNPNIVETLNRTAELLAQDEEALCAQVERFLDDHAETRHGELSLALEPLRSLGPALYGRVARAMVARLKGDARSLTERHIDAVIRLIEKPGPARTVQLPAPWCVHRQYGRLIVARRTGAMPTFYCRREEMPASIEIAEIGAALQFERMTIDDPRPLCTNRNRLVACFDADKARGPVTVRQWKAGDAFHPLGAPGRKKLKDLFIDLKIPPRERRGVPVLLFGEEIAWVCGLRMDERFKLEAGSRSALRVTLHQGGQI